MNLATEIVFSYLGSNLIFNEIEYFCYVNLLLLTLFVYMFIYFCFLYCCLLYFNTIFVNHDTIEIVITFLSLIILLFIISPSLIIVLDYDIIFIPTLIIYTLGYQ